MHSHMKYEGPDSYQSKDMANVKVFVDKQTDKWTHRQAKNYMPLIYLCGGIKIFRWLPTLMSKFLF